MSGKMKYIAWALVAFVIGGGLAWVQNNYGNKVLPTEQAATTPGEQPTVTDVPASSASSVIPDAPAMPESAESGQAPETSTAVTAAIDSAPVAGIAVGGPFTLTDQKGVAVTEKSWPGKYLLVFFGFSNCPDVCPATLQKLSTIMETYDPSGAKLQPMMVTVDPARDNPEALAKYMAAFNANIVGLTGTPEQIDAVKKAYKVYASPAPAVDHADHGAAAGQIDHSSFVYLMSPDGQALEIISASLSAEEMLAKIKVHADTAAVTPTSPVAAPVETPATPAQTPAQAPAEQVPAAE